MYPCVENFLRCEPPYFDEPEVTPEEVLEVAFGLRQKDSVGRDRDDLLFDSPLALFFEHLGDDPDAMLDFYEFLGQHRSTLPASVKQILDARADAAARQEKEWWK